MATERPRSLRARLERLRAAGIEAMRFGEFVEECVARGDDARA